jgi:predicted DNA-binding WGR domain protein/tetratricopeptide (TPR) repeat protein
MRKYLTYLDRASYLFWCVEVTGSSYIVSRGKVGTVGQVSVHVADSEEESLRSASLLIEEHEQAGYVTTSEGRIVNYCLPSEMKSMFAEERVVNTAIGSFVLPSFPEIKMISVLVDHHTTPQDAFLPSFIGNPYREQKGLFCATAYSLVTKAPQKHPSVGMLVWLPLANLFGVWNAVGRQLYIFPETTWTDVYSRLNFYLTCCAEPEQLLNVLSIEKALDNFDFIPDDLEAQIDWILAKPQPLKLAEASEFLRRYEPRLLRHPWCKELEKTYDALVGLYHDIGKVYEREADYALAIGWLRRSLQVVGQSQHFRNKIFIDIFIQLSFCYFETSQFDLSLRYMKMYQLYDSSAHDTCEQIMSSISRVKKLYDDALTSCKRANEQRSEECYAEAIRITHRALVMAPNDPLLHFNLACFYSLSFKTEDSLRHLEEAIKKGYDNHGRIVSERDLENIRGTYGFKAIRQKYF